MRGPAFSSRRALGQGTVNRACKCLSANRRWMLGTGIAAVAFPAQAISVGGGCSLSDEGLRTRIVNGVAAQNGGLGNEALIPSSGDMRLDKAFGQVLANLAGQFHVRPGFGFYDDSQSGPNAYATPVTRLPDTVGTVAFGRTLLARFMAQDDGDILVMGVCAHEFGHVVQQHSSFYDRLRVGQATSRRLELHADLLAGYYMGSHAKRFTPPQLIALGKGWQGIGDTDFNNPDHHGTPEERLEAVEFGFRLAREGRAFSLQDVCEIGARYLGA